MEIGEILKVVRNVARAVEAVIDIFTDQKEEKSMNAIKGIKIACTVIGSVISVISAIRD